MKPFQVLHYDYINTGGNTMVGVFTVWLPEDKRTVYALTNEEGCTLSVVDYICNEINVDNYDELYIECISFDQLTGNEEYFELYRHCLNEYTKSDCRYFGITRGVPYRLLSDELKAEVGAGYLLWLTKHDYDILTDGDTIVMHPDYEEDHELRYACNWKTWHDDLINKDTTDEEMEAFYGKRYRLTFNGRCVYLPFNADTFNKINDLLDSVIKEW
jgi:hypothetical protein